MLAYDNAVRVLEVHGLGVQDLEITESDPVFRRHQLQQLSAAAREFLASLHVPSWFFDLGDVVGVDPAGPTHPDDSGENGSHAGGRGPEKPSRPAEPAEGQGKADDQASGDKASGPEQDKSRERKEVSTSATV